MYSHKIREFSLWGPNDGQEEADVGILGTTEDRQLEAIARSQENFANLHDRLDRLRLDDPRAAEILVKRFGIGGVAQWRVADLAAEYRVSQRRIGQLIERGLEKLRDMRHNVLSAA